MYITRIELDRNKKATWNALKNPNLFHGAIESAFNDKTERKLWRIDSLFGRRYLMIVSRTLPDFTTILRQYAPDNVEVQSKNYDAFLDSIKKGSLWEFRLTAAPMISKKPDGIKEKRGIPMPIRKCEEQVEWLNRKGENHGFKVIGNVMIENPGPTLFMKGEQGARQPVSFLKITYNGKLTVTDPELFRDAMINGIGREKAYGNGLLTIASIHNP